MNKKIRNKALIVLAGLSFIGLTAGVGVGIQKHALRTSYLAQFDNDKSESELVPIPSDADLVSVVGSFSLKKVWSTISARQAYELHTNPLYAFKLSDAIDFSKLDAKFANLFFDLQTTDTTQVSGNSINNLVVFVFDKTTKKRVANRAFGLNLSGFATVDSEDFIDNFIDKSSSFEIDPKTKILKTTFPSGSILPSAFAVKFQDELTNKLRKAAPDAFKKAKDDSEQPSSASATTFQEQSTSGSTDGQNGNTNTQSGNNANTQSAASTPQTTPPAAPKTPAKPEKPKTTAPAATKPVETPKQAVKLPEIPTNILKKALEDTLKEFGQLKLVSTSGLQSLISNNYTLLPVNSTKSFIKITPDDQNGVATINLKLVDKNNKEKTIQLRALGFNSINEVKTNLTAKILKNQQNYFSLRPEIQKYLEKNPNFNLSEYAHDGIATQIKQLFQESEKEFTKIKIRIFF